LIDGVLRKSWTCLSILALQKDDKHVIRSCQQEPYSLVQTSSNVEPCRWRRTSITDIQRIISKSNRPIPQRLSTIINRNIQMITINNAIERQLDFAINIVRSCFWPRLLDHNWIYVGLLTEEHSIWLGFLGVMRKLKALANLNTASRYKGH